MEKKMSKKADSELNKIKNEMPSDENELEELKKDIKDELARKNKYGKYYDVERGSGRNHDVLQGELYQI